MKYSGGIRTQHIAPIELFPGAVIPETDIGAVILETDINESFSDYIDNIVGGRPVDGYPKKQVFDKSQKIKFARVIMFNDSRTSVIDADYAGHNTSNAEGMIELWVKQSNKPNLVFRARDGKLQVEIDNRNHKFGDSQPGGTSTHPKRRRTYSESNTGPYKVRLSGIGGIPAQVSLGQIVLIQIWPEMAVPDKS